jgi:hypothetical protein
MTDGKLTDAVTLKFSLEAIDDLLLEIRRLRPGAAA